MKCDICVHPELREHVGCDGCLEDCEVREEEPNE